MVLVRWHSVVLAKKQQNITVYFSFTISAEVRQFCVVARYEADISTETTNNTIFDEFSQLWVSQHNQYRIENGRQRLQYFDN